MPDQLSSKIASSSASRPYLRALPAVYEARVIEARESRFKEAYLVDFETIRCRLPPGEEPQTTFTWGVMLRNPIAVTNLRRFLEAIFEKQLPTADDAEYAMSMVWGVDQVAKNALVLLQTNRLTSRRGVEICSYNWLGRSDGASELPDLPLTRVVPYAELEAQRMRVLDRAKSIEPIGPPDTRAVEVRRFAELDVSESESTIAASIEIRRFAELDLDD